MYSWLQAWIQIRHVLDFDCRYRKMICTVGFEPNLMHHSRLKDLQESYRKCGWKAKTDFVFMCLSQSWCSCLYSVTWRCRLLSWWGLGLVLKKRTSDLFTGSRVFHCYNWLLLNQSKDIAPNSWKRKLHYYIFQSKDQSWERNRKETLSLLHRSKRWVLFTLSDQRVILLVILVMSVILGHEKNKNS